MKARRFRYVVAFCAAWMLGTVAFAQTKDEKKPQTKVTAQPSKPGDKPSAAQPGKPGEGTPSPEQLAMMETWMKAATPGEGHAKLKPLAGRWSYVTKWRMSPEQPWEESTGKAEYRWILGGRILAHEVKNNPGPSDAMMGGPFEGFGLAGYDNVSKKYFSVWTDSMGTGVMLSTGTADSSGKTFTYSGEFDDPMTGKKKTAKSITKIIGDDKVVFEMYDKTPDGKEFQNLEVTYTRQK